MEDRKITELPTLQKQKGDLNLLKQILLEGLRSHGIPAKAIPGGIELETVNGPSIIKIGLPNIVSE